MTETRQGNLEKQGDYDKISGKKRTRCTRTTDAFKDGTGSSYAVYTVWQLWHLQPVTQQRLLTGCRWFALMFAAVARPSSPTLSMLGTWSPRKPGRGIVCMVHTPGYCHLWQGVIISTTNTPCKVVWTLAFTFQFGSPLSTDNIDSLFSLFIDGQ